MAQRTHVEFYSRSDIRDLLEAIDRANGGALDKLQDPTITTYRTGFRDAVRAIAAAVGVNVSLPEPQASALSDRIYWTEEGLLALPDPRQIG